jgi:polyhydroxyalkanoate synthesis regulator phasin
MTDDPADRILSAIAQLRADITQLRVDMMERIDRLQDRLTANHETEIVNFGLAERAERSAKVAREDVQSISEQVNALTRQVRSLSGRVDHLEDRGAHP